MGKGMRWGRGNSCREGMECEERNQVWGEPEGGGENEPRKSAALRGWRDSRTCQRPVIGAILGSL